MWTDLGVIAAVIALLVGVNGLYVAAEFAIIAVRPSRLAQLEEAGHPLASSLLGTVRSSRELDAYISTAQAGITMASLGLAMYGEAALATWITHWLPAGWTEHTAHLVAGAIALSVLTYLHIVPGEMIPKTWALSDSESTALKAALPMRLSRVLFWPIVAPLTLLGQWVLRLLRVPNPSTRERVLSADELGEVISQSTAGGLLSEREGEMLLNIFEFSQQTASGVMTPRDRIHALSIDLPGPDVVARLEASPHSRLPVYRGALDRIEGALHVKDFVPRLLETGGAPDNWTDLIRPVPSVEAALGLEALLELFKVERARLAIVCDETGATVGLVTLQDVAEEIVGDLADQPGETAAAHI
jgi:CBS domain containing-hemolysin-like protein